MVTPQEGDVDVQIEQLDLAQYLAMYNSQVDGGAELDMYSSQVDGDPGDIEEGGGEEEGAGEPAVVASQTAPQVRFTSVTHGACWPFLLSSRSGPSRSKTSWIGGIREGESLFYYQYRYKSVEADNSMH
jgi:hypothetical protein